MLAYLRACGYLCPPVSKPHVFLCARVYMDQYACEYMQGWGFMRAHTGGAETHPRTSPTAQPPVVGSMGEARGEKVPNQAAVGGLCVRPRVGWGGVGWEGLERFS